MKVKNSAKLVFLLISVIIGTSFLMPVSPVFAQTAASNAALIQSLQAQIAVLMAKTQQLQASQGQAQPGAGGGGGGGGFASIPVSSTVMPANFDDDFDDIVQFNNLIVRSVSGPSFPAEIKASYEVGVRCQKFLSESAGGVEYACPLSPSVLYTIQLDSDTRLLLRNRKRASLADFEAGDRINVYGFTNSGVSSIDALVVRNLTKPARLSFVQLNNMEALSAPSAGVSPASFTVVNKHFSPCRDFSDGPNNGITLPCPLGLEIMEQPQSSANVGGGSSGSGSAYYPVARKYLIEVTRQTTILQRDRTPMSLSDIAVGDILNIYGSYTNSSQNIKAIVIRDLSKPAQNLGSLQVSVNDMNMLCWATPQSSSQSVQSGGGGAGGGGSSIPAPCGTIYGAQVDLYDASGARVGTQTTERGAAFFENLRAGEYTIVAGANGYNKSKTNVSIGAGEITFTTINLSRFELPPPFPTPPPINNQTPVISGVKGPTALKVGETGTWSVSAYDPENGPLSYSVIWGDEAVYPTAFGAPSALEPVRQTTTFTHSYARDGNYTPTFIVTDNQGLSAKTSISVNVGATTPQPPGYLYLSPVSFGIRVGQQQKIQAFYQSPTICPPLPGLYCAPAAPYPVHATWSSSNANVAKVLADSSGTVPVPSAIVTGVAHGTAEIKAAWTQYSNSYTAKATVEVKPASTQPSITVLSPNGGEVWSVGKSYEIKWNPGGISKDATIQLRLRDIRYDPGTTAGEISFVNVANSGTYFWTVPTSIGHKTLGDGNVYKITLYRLTESSPWAEKMDESDAPFSIVAGLSIVTSSLPNAAVGTIYSTALFASGGSGSYSWSVTPGSLPPGLTLKESPTSSCIPGTPVCPPSLWTIFGTPTAVGAYTFTVTVGDNIGTPKASKQFTINVNSTTQPSITVLSPNGGETWQRGTTQTIQYGAYTVQICQSGWEICDSSDSYFKITSATTQPSITVLLNIYLSPQNNLNGYYVVLATNVASPFNWAVGQPNVDNNPSGTSIADGKYYICISNGDTGQSDCSNAPFSIVAGTASLPDLKVIDITIDPPTIRGNQLFTPSYTIKNDSQVPVTTPFQVIDGGAGQTVSALGAGETKIIVGPKTGLTLPGYNNLGGRVDFNNTVAESNENNNDFSKPFLVLPTYEQEGQLTLKVWETVKLNNGLIFHADGTNVYGQLPYQIKVRVFDGNNKYSEIGSSPLLAQGGSWIFTAADGRKASITFNSISVGAVGNANWSAVVNVTSNPTNTGPTVSPSKTSVIPGEKISVKVSGGPANALDWVGLYLVGSDNESYIDWKYLNNTQSAPSSGVSSATIDFTMPTTPGKYEFRLLANNEYTSLTSSPVVVVATLLMYSPNSLQTASVFDAIKPIWWPTGF